MEHCVMQVTDPVCGMQTYSAKAAASETHQGQTYYFCSTSCHNQFRANCATIRELSSRSKATGSFSIASPSGRRRSHRTRFAAHGITNLHAEMPRSDLYLTALRAFNSGRVGRRRVRRDAQGLSDRDRSG
jgi:YHS domain-containing protein